jgi:hypothetical protein
LLPSSIEANFVKDAFGFDCVFVGLLTQRAI